MKLSLSIHKNKILLLPALLALALGLWLAVPPVFCAGAVLCLAAAGLIRIRATGRHAWLLPALAACAASFMTVVLVQIANETIRLVPVWKLLLGAVCALLPMLLLYLPLSFLPRGGGKPAVLIASGLLLFLGVVNAFTYAARGTGMSPADFSAAGTALNVVGNYHLVFTPWMYLAVTVWAACALALAGAEIETPPRRRGFRLAALALLLVLTPTLRFALRPIRSLPWGREGAVNNGFLLNFTLELNELLVTKPAGYSPARVSETEAVYAAGQTAPERLPTVIVVMNEAFSDPRIYGELETDLPLMPVIDGLTENTVKGYAGHEKETLEKVTAARAAAMKANTVDEKVAADKALSGALAGLRVSLEAYPELKANQNFLQLQTELSDIENMLSAARRFFNSTTREYNNACEVFPSNIIAGMFGFRRASMYEASEGREVLNKAPEVRF